MLNQTTNTGFTSKPRRSKFESEEDALGFASGSKSSGSSKVQACTKKELIYCMQLVFLMLAINICVRMKCKLYKHEC